MLSKKCELNRIASTVHFVCRDSTSQQTEERHFIEMKCDVTDVPADYSPASTESKWHCSRTEAGVNPPRIRLA
jgi:hypothetical protein